MTVQKEKLERLMIERGADPRAWFLAAEHVSDLHNHTASEVLKGRTPKEVRDGETPDISGLLQFEFWELVYYQTHEEEFPSKTGGERLGWWAGRAQEYGDKMCYNIIDCETKQKVVRSMVRSAEHTDRPNRALESLVQQCRRHREQNE